MFAHPPESGQIDEEEALRRLGEIQHIVVLMMENRSFDQMLGFLEDEGLDVDGLSKAKPNFDAAGNEYEPFEWPAEETAPEPPEGMKPKVLDPDHSVKGVGVQLEDGNTGFVKSFAGSRKDEDKKRIELAEQFLRVPMGHYGAQHLPVYRHLAHNFCVCDRWHSSVPGDTWPNRLYSLAGTDAPRLGYEPGLFTRLKRVLKRLPKLDFLGDAPIFEVDAFTHQLCDSQWRWYSHDPATLRAADRHYRRLGDLKRDNFTFFNRRRVHPRTQALESAIVKRDSFLDDAAK
ncbi:MAG TPA: alkaline phosphatase family protein, partial [Solirubrobacterales bacterium]